MGTRPWAEVRRVLGEALDTPPESRRQRVEALCAGDETLRREVEAFLEADAQTRTLPDPVSGNADAVRAVLSETTPLVAVEGRRIGRYEVRRVIGAGGMGVVYEAVQDSPRRPVALKVMRTGLSGRHALRRFEFESQLLARLRHPGIAQVYEAGTHADPAGGPPVPFFAMEFVPGARTLLEFARDMKLAPRASVELLVKVCEAVHHGHTRGVVHRDLKPGNILVDPIGQPKVIDFGVARVTDGDAAATLRTDVGQLVGTLQYMSPEQCRADPADIDARSDVYALGVIMHELLCGRPPYELSRRPVPEAARIIRDQPPTRLGTVDRALRGDLETITLKALEKDRERRYGSALELAEDLQRYLRQEPVRARPPTAFYQARMFARRNRGLVTAASAIFLALAGGLAGTTWALRVVGEARARAQAEAENATAVSAFLRDILVMPSPYVAPGEKRTVEEALDIAAARVDSAGLKPEAEGAVRAAIGATYRSLGRLDKAEAMLARATDLRRSALGPGHPDTLAARSELAGVMSARGRSDEAVALLRAALTDARARLGDRHAATVRALYELGWALHQRGEHAESERILGAMVDASTALNGPTDPRTIKARLSRAMPLIDLKATDEAEAILLPAVADARAVLGPSHPDYAYALNLLGYLRRQQGRPEEAVAACREASEIGVRALGAGHPFTLFWQNATAWAELACGRYADAASHFEAVLQRRRTILGETHADTLDTRAGLARCALGLGRVEEARRELTAVVDAAGALGPAGAPTLRLAARGLADLAQQTGDSAAAAKYEALAAEPANPPRSSPAAGGR